MDSRTFFIFLAIVVVLGFYFIGNEMFDFPLLISKTFFRMLAAYVLSLIFSLSLGLIMSQNKKLFVVLFPILDVLQSVPILGFLPFAVLFIIHSFPVVGAEIATIFLIFTSMTWAILFNVIEGMRSIPSDLRDASKLNGISGFNYLFHVVLPALYAPVISGSITGWGGGWYFLVAGEYISFGKDPPYVLEGVGSYIAQHTYSGDLIHFFIALSILALMVLFMNLFFWRPLLSRVSRYLYSAPAVSSVDYNKLIRFFDSLYARFRAFCLKHLLFLDRVLLFMNISPFSHATPDQKPLIPYDLFLIIGVLLSIFLVFSVSGKPISILYELPISLILTFLRMGLAFLIASIWTLTVAVLIGRNKRILDLLMPIFDVCQSLPAIAIFPIIFVFVIKLLGVQVGIQVASVLLLLTGMQWYLLFNLIRAVSSIPQEFFEVSSVLSLSFWARTRNLILPALIPAFIIGSIQAFGGGWNATIVSEYISSGTSTYYTDGIGYRLVVSAVNGDVSGIILAILVMVLAIIIINNLIWKKALAKAELYKL
ncbi:ABC transporter permease subunit [Candidatus Micrarchaeota archaeon]|nr:ABC transporter permease subunit [Candidatus Micrarchaeota archaeon]